ncbi:MAG TPA: hypothetical protein VFT56_05145 [Sphingomonas sp.]|nr:hypothetical protein [Sphingomonas sp.]
MHPAINHITLTICLPTQASRRKQKSAESTAGVQSEWFCEGDDIARGVGHDLFFPAFALTATLSFGDGIATRAGDAFEVSATAFAAPLGNRLTPLDPETVAVRAL